jgi:hypothetical protein
MPFAATYRDQLERLKVAIGAATGALKRLLYAQTSCAYTIRNVDDAREFLQLPEELLGDERVIAGPVDERVLCRMAANASNNDGEKNKTTVQNQAQDCGHEGCLLHIPGFVSRWWCGVMLMLLSMESGEVTMESHQSSVARRQSPVIRTAWCPRRQEKWVQLHHGWPALEAPGS